MVFHPPSFLPALPNPPDNITIEQFLASDAHGRRPLQKSRNPFTCGLSGKSYKPSEVVERIDYLSRALAKRLKFDPREGTEWDRVVCLFSLNTIDYIPTALSVHRISGITTAASAAFGADELEHQLRSSGSKAIFTCASLLDTALKAAKKVGIPEENVFILPMAGVKHKGPQADINTLIQEGEKLEQLKDTKFVNGQGARQVAFLMYSSGTSGLPKAVMLTHQNIIANILQAATIEHLPRKHFNVDTQIMLGLLPFGHIFALCLIGFLSVFRGDEVIVLPKFEFEPLLKSIQEYKIEELVVVPPVLVQMASGQEKCRQYDLSSVRCVFSGAAPLGEELIQDIGKLYPKWHMVQGYGMTESAPLSMCSLETDLLLGSSGCLVPGIKAKIIDADGNEVTEYEKRGEILVQGPNIAAGYLNNEKANAETFVWDEDGRWLKTGDEVLVRKAPSGTEHFFIVDRIKELIKVKGYQVAPAELEAHLLSHPMVDDCAVISVPHPHNGEAPKAFIVKAPRAKDTHHDELHASIHKHVEDSKPSYKWLKGGIEFLDAVPKSPSGKILRKILREKEKEKRREQGAKL
ncbi:AMP-binding enzyme [Sarocladium strictum]